MEIFDIIKSVIFGIVEGISSFLGDSLPRRTPKQT